MLQSRRGFLIGVGAVLTKAFVKDALFIHRNNQPLLTSPWQVSAHLWCPALDHITDLGRSFPKSRRSWGHLPRRASYRQDRRV